MTSPPLVRILYTLVAIQFLEALRSNVQLPIPPLKLSIRSVATIVANIWWISSLLTELGVDHPQQPVIYCDNFGATNLCANPIFHSRMRPVAIDYHFICEQVQNDYFGWHMYPLHINLLTHSLKHCHVNNFTVSSPRLDSHLGRSSCEGMIKIVD